MKFFNDLIETIMSKSRAGFGLSNKTSMLVRNEPGEMITSVMTAVGEVSSIAYSDNFLRMFDEMNVSQKQALFITIASELDIDISLLRSAIENYSNTPDAENFTHVTTAVEPGWTELLRRLNATAHGTVRLVKMRAELLTIIRTDPSLARLDVSFRALLRNWFSPSFLVLRPIDWSTPANILEKIIAYEAVHEIESWDDLRSRLAPDDRRCFAFFHPSMEDEPLIFVEVALTSEIPGQINEVLETDRSMIYATDASCAIFYSISNCQKGLAGISFGNFLIKQVAQALQREYPNLKNFLTLSPVPYFSKWLEKTEPNTLASFAEIDWSEASEEEEQTLIEAAGRYFMNSTRKDKQPNDPVARFHLGNGALLDRINLAGNLSQKGLSESFGLMVNYRYDLPNVEKNHEAYAKEQKIEISQGVKKLLKTP